LGVFLKKLHHNIDLQSLEGRYIICTKTKFEDKLDFKRPPYASTKSMTTFIKLSTLELSTTCCNVKKDWDWFKPFQSFTTITWIEIHE
jgi:hypothetical protein